MVNHTYKAGDKVEFIEEFNSHKTGDVVTVIGGDEDGVWVENPRGITTYCFTHRVKPHVEQPKPEPTFKVGDKVYVDYPKYFKQRHVYTITKIDPELIACFEETPYRSSTFRLTHANVDETQFKVGLQGGSNMKEITDQLNELDAQISAALSIVQNAGVKVEELRRLIADSIIVEPAEEARTATRKDAVNAAKDYVNTKLDSDGDVTDQYGTCYTPQFIVNEKKRTVVVILRGFASGNIYSKAVAKCAPGDVFNAHIGKAIALARVIEEDVPAELINAPQPERAEVGMLTVSKNTDTRFRLISRCPELDHRLPYGRAFHYERGGKDWICEEQVTIISDTDVEY